MPDFRDYTPESHAVQDVLAKSRALKLVRKKSPASVNLMEWCSPIEDQEDLGSCTANAGVGIMEYFQRRAFGKYLDASRIFLYKVSRILDGDVGDVGSYLRTTMKAMVLFGVPPEKYWPYLTADFEKDPTPFCYSFAQSYKAVKYYRLDPPGKSGRDVLLNIKEYLAAKLPSMFGFSVYSSMPGLGQGTGDIPFPRPNDSFEGGHAVVAVGYDDAKTIGKDKGALLIRNSWGTEWGEKGYGWLPYAYVERGLAADFWSLVDAAFVDTELFEGP